MKLNQFGSNQTVIFYGQNEVFFSYNTPVCAVVNGKIYKTDKFYSKTTSRHINSYLNHKKAAEIKLESQSFFDNLLK